MKNLVKEFITEEDGVGVVEMVLILAVLVCLVALFKDEVVSVVEDALDKFSETSDSIMDDLD